MDPLWCLVRRSRDRISATKTVLWLFFPQGSQSLWGWVETGQSQNQWLSNCLPGFEWLCFSLTIQAFIVSCFFNIIWLGGLHVDLTFFSAIQKGLVDMTSILLECIAGIHLPIITRIAGFWSCRNTITFSSMIYQDLYTVWFYTGDVPVRRLRWFCCFFLI